MPKILTEKQKYCLRVTHAKLWDCRTRESTMEKSFKELSSCIDQDPRVHSCLAVNHQGKQGNNPHTHFVIDCYMSIPTLRELIKKFVPPKSYSLKKVTDDKIDVYSYLFHECSNIIQAYEVILFRKNISDENIEHYYNHNISVREKWQDGGSKMKLVNDIINRLNDPTEMLNQMWACNQHKLICYHIYMYYKDGWFPSKFQMERYIHTVQRQIHANNNTELDGFKKLYGEYFPLYE